MTVLHRAQLTKYRAAFQQPGRAVNEVSRSEKVGSLSVALTQGGLFKNELGKARKLHRTMLLSR